MDLGTGSKTSLFSPIIVGHFSLGVFNNHRVSIFSEQVIFLY